MANPFEGFATPIEKEDSFEGFAEPLSEENLDEEKIGLPENIFRTAVGAVRDTAQATIDFSDYVSGAVPDFLQAGIVKDEEGVQFLYGKKFIEAKRKNEEQGIKSIQLPKIEEPTGAVGSVARDILGFAIPFSKLKLLTPVTKKGKLAEITARGVAAEQLAFSPEEARLSNLIQEYPQLQNPVTEYLQADPDDTETEGRFKMALEGAGLGLAVETIIKGFSRIRQKTKLEKPTEVEKPKPTETEEPSIIDTTTTLQQAKRKIETQPPIEPITPQRPVLDKAGNINLRKFDTPDTVKDFIYTTGKDHDDFFEARRGVVKFGTQGEELKKLADMSGLTVESLLKRKKGEAFNAETAYKARELLEQSSRETESLAKEYAEKLDNNTLTDSDRFKFKQAYTKNVAIQEQVAGITAEAGRALSGFRMGVGADQKIKNQIIKEIVEAPVGKKASIDEIIDGISRLDDPEKIAKFAKDTYKPTTLDKVQEAWINGLLSAPTTHEVNIIGNSITALNTIAESATAATLGLARRDLDKVTFKETGARILGSIYGFKDGLIMAGKVIKDMDAITDPFLKLEMRREKAIPGAVGEVIRTPSRFLAAEDTFFKTIAYRQEIMGQAVRKAVKEGKKGKELNARIKEILSDVENEFPDIHIKGIEQARINTFTNPLGRHGRAVQAGLADYPFLKFFAPFVRTPINIIKYAYGRTPAQLLSKNFRDRIKAGGADGDLAKSQLLFSALTFGTLLFEAKEGFITGRGPSDTQKRRALLETGWQPYSIKVGENYYGYHRFEPIGILLGVTADMADISNQMEKEKLFDDEQKYEEYAKLVSMITASFAENLTNKTYLSGLTDVVQILSDPDRYAERNIQSLFGSVIPTVGGYIRKSEDPVKRDVQGFIDKLYDRTPGLSVKLPPRRNIFGEIQKYSDIAAPDIFGDYKTLVSPIRKSKKKDDLVLDELLSLEYFPSLPTRQINGVDLDSKQYEYLLSRMEFYGAKTQVKNLIQQPNYKKYTKEMKVDLIRGLINLNLDLARLDTQKKYPELQEKIAQKMQQKYIN